MVVTYSKYTGGVGVQVRQYVWYYVPRTWHTIMNLKTLGGGGGGWYSYSTSGLRTPEEGNRHE